MSSGKSRRPYTIGRTARAVKRYFKQASRSVQEDYLNAMREICTGPYPQDNPRSIAHLKGQHLCNYRYRLGERRILYEIDETQRQIHVIDFGPRGDIY